MSRYDYERSAVLVAHDEPFYALIMAAMRKADSVNQRLLWSAFPDVWDELDARYNAPGGVLPTDPEAVTR